MFLLQWKQGYRKHIILNSIDEIGAEFADSLIKIFSLESQVILHSFT